jgi:hypothetical protein
VTTQLAIAVSVGALANWRSERLDDLVQAITRAT